MEMTSSCLITGRNTIVRPFPTTCTVGGYRSLSRRSTVITLRDAVFKGPPQRIYPRVFSRESGFTNRSHLLKSVRRNQPLVMCDASAFRRDDPGNATQHHHVQRTQRLHQPAD